MFELLTGTGLAAASGLGAFAPLLALGGLDRFTDLVSLPEGWACLGSDTALVLLGVLTLIDIIADKIPAVDSVNDIIQTVIRPASGGIAFGAGSAATTVAVPTPDHLYSTQVWLPVILGIVIALASHLTKSSTRLASHAVSAGAAGPVLSASEDAMSIGLIAAAILAPVAVVLVLAALIYLAITLGRWFAQRKTRARAQNTLANASS